MMNCPLPPPERLSIALRGYAVTPRNPAQKRPPRQQPVDTPSEWTLIFDTETFTDAAQQLRFGTYQVRQHGKLREVGLFYDPDSLTGQEQELLAHYAAAKGYALYTVADFIEEVFFKIGYELRATIIGFNLPFDLSRMAIRHYPARGKAMRGGFGFKLTPRWYRPRVQVKHLSRRAYLIQFTAPARQRHSRGQRKRQLLTPVRRGFFVDVKTLAAALTSQNHSLDSLGKLLHIPHPKLATDEHGGPLTEEYLRYALGDVEATWECFEILQKRYLAHAFTETPVHRIYSEAGLGKAYLKEMGIHPWRSLQPEFPAELLGIILSTYYGGRSEVHWRREAVQVQYCDFLSMYPTVCTLMGLWRFVIAQGVEWEDATQWTQDCLEHVELGQLQDPAFWSALPILVQVVPEGDLFPVRTRYGQEPQYTIGLNHLSGSEPLWYTLADCLASKPLTSKAPRVLKAMRFRPKGMQAGLRPISISGKPQYRVDPAKDDFYQRVIDLRREVKEHAKTTTTKKAESLASEQWTLKILANATSYGIFVELNAEEQDDPVTVQCHGPGGMFPTTVHQLEEPGTYFHPLLATLITGAARLMLAITERLLLDARLNWAFCDTDSMAIAKPAAMENEVFLKKCQRIREWFTPLNPYAVKGSILNLEAANYQIKDGKATQALESLYCWAVSSKRYALFNLDDNKQPVLRKASAHGLGHLLPPYQENQSGIPDPVVPLKELGVQRWQYDLWYCIVQAGIQGHHDPLERLQGLSAHAASRYAATTQELLRWFQNYNQGKLYREQVKPFNFLLAYQGQRVMAISEIDAIELPDTTQKRKRRKNPSDLPRAVAPYHRDPRHAVQQCFDRNTGKPVSPRQLKSYRRALAQYHLHPESKFLNADYSDHGITQRRHIEITRITYIGKEANRWEEQFFLGLDSEAQTEYGEPPYESEKLMGQLRQAAKKYGQRTLAKMAKISLRQLSDILLGKAKPKRETLARLANAAQSLWVG